MVLVTNGKFIRFLIRTKKMFAFLRSFNNRPNPYGTRILKELTLVILRDMLRNTASFASPGYSEARSLHYPHYGAECYKQVAPFS